MFSVVTNKITCLGIRIFKVVFSFIQLRQIWKWNTQTQKKIIQNSQCQLYCIETKYTKNIFKRNTLIILIQHIRFILKCPPVWLTVLMTCKSPLWNEANKTYQNITNISPDLFVSCRVFSPFGIRRVSLLSY